MSVTPRSRAAWMVATLSCSSLSPYIPDMPMQPRATEKTSGPARSRWMRGTVLVWVMAELLLGNRLTRRYAQCRGPLEASARAAAWQEPELDCAKDAGPHPSEEEKPMVFRDRADAGRHLASKLLAYAGHARTLVLGLARGGVLVAEQVAQ